MIGRSLELRADRWLAPRSITFLRVSMGFVFLGFGLLKFVPGLSPAEELAWETVAKLTFGLVPGDVGILLVAALESAIGPSLLSGLLLRVGLALLAVAMGGILAPLVLFPAELFVRHADLGVYAPTPVGQYVLENVVLLAGALVVAVRAALGAAAPGQADTAPAAQVARAAAPRQAERRRPDVAA